jgi:hypothetical protein
VNLEGSLDAFSLPDVFQLLSLTKKTGGLHLTDGQVRGVVRFHEGSITGATADEGRQSLARRLVGIGVVDDAALRRAVERAQSQGVGVARALLDAGAVDGETVQVLAGEQVVDAVFDLLRWSRGDFAFGMDEANPDDVGIALPADQVIAEATRRRQVWDSVSRVIPSPDVVLVMPVVLPADPTVSRDEWALLALVDGQRSVGQLVELSGAGQFSVVSALAGLVQRGMLAIADEDAPDHVALVTRRQQTVSTLEGGLATDVGPAAAVATAPASDAGPPTGSPAEEPGAAAEPRPSGIPGVRIGGGAHRPAGVVPPRPDPTRPTRLPEHPDMVPERRTARPSPAASAPPVTTGSVTSSGAAVAAAPAASAAIERDPSINRSLLLKLIAGVKGL